MTPRGAGRPRSPEDVAAAIVDAVARHRAEIEVASPAVRFSGALAQIRPEWFEALGRRAGAVEVAAKLSAANRENR